MRVTNEPLRIASAPTLANASMIVGLSGWMDGGDVSTGAVAQLADALKARPAGYIEPADFYIYDFPGSMELAAMSRPHTRIKEGVVVEFQWPSNRFYVSEPHQLVLFRGREPNMNWDGYLECLFSAAGIFNVEMIYFIGSVAGLVPHTREPRISCSVSEPSLKPVFERMGLRFSNYEGPASIITYVTKEAHQRGLKVASFVAEIPAYIQGPNPKCIESVLRRMAGILGIEVRLHELRQMADEFEAKVSRVTKDRAELNQLISKLEEDYDSEVFKTQMGDLRDWLEKRGIRLD